MSEASDASDRTEGAEENAEADLADLRDVLAKITPGKWEGPSPWAEKKSSLVMPAMLIAKLKTKRAPDQAARAKEALKTAPETETAQFEERKRDLRRRSADLTLELQQFQQMRPKGKIAGSRRGSL